ncbi:MAG: hypothetical protein MK052_10320 [Alphaproteobacteria bacterium]|nr:hypothetical protein [Alphaproteobacteria bacterium]
MIRIMNMRKTHISAKRLKTNARYWELALACRIDADTVRQIQGCTPK